MVLFVVVKGVMGGPSISAAEADARIKAGTAVLIDVREPDEWSGGVAASLLRKEGYRAVNAGGFGNWSRAGRPVRQP